MNTQFKGIDTNGRNNGSEMSASTSTQQWATNYYCFYRYGMLTVSFAVFQPNPLSSFLRIRESRAHVFCRFVRSFLFVAFNEHECFRHGHSLSVVRNGNCLSLMRPFFLFISETSLVMRVWACVVRAHLDACVGRKTRQFLIRFST